MFVFIPFQSALGWDHQAELSKHGSQTDAAKGFGGKYGVQERTDKVQCTCTCTCIRTFVHINHIQYIHVHVHN